jgi:L-threonylcarbamoyladenylate synthase
MSTAFENDLENCLTVLESGGLILYPTDTIWGIGCDATNAEAVAKIYKLKNRADEKSMIILLEDENDINKYVTQPHVEIFDYIKGVSKPTTIIYDGAVNLAENLINADGTVAIRLVNESFCKHLIKRFGKPVVSTSANISGYPSPVNFSDIDINIINGVDYVVQFRQDEITAGTPSSVVKWNKDGSYTIIRH